MTQQVFVASTAFGLATVVAGLEDGRFPAAERRVLVQSNNATTPEAAYDIPDVAGTAAWLSRFDAVHSYNAVIAPQHPSGWVPRHGDLPIWERHLRASWQLSGAPVHLVVESIQVVPSLAVAHIFADARIDVYADGLMSYGPTRTKLPAQVGTRIERLLHLDLVPGLQPMLLSEWGVPGRVIRTEAFRGVIKEAVGAGRPLPDRPFAVLLGQYLSALGILSPAEEDRLHRRMIRGAVAAGHARLVFKPHPSAPYVNAAPLQAEAAAGGATLEVREQPELVETWYEQGGVGLVVGCFSTGLMTAAACYGIGALQVGTGELLDRLAPYQNSNRVPLTLVDALIPDAGRAGAAPVVLGPGTGAKVQPLVTAVGYVMQPRLYPGRRAETARYLAEHFAVGRRYFKRRRLSRLQLPGALPPPARTRRLRRAVRRAVRWAVRVPGASGLARRLRGRVSARR